MKRLILAVAALACFAIFTSTASAQVDGYRFGVGIRQANQSFRGFNGIRRGGIGLGTVFVEPREQPPFFAQFPPVYYNEIVPRNYGVSPYAVPAGVMPVEGIGYGVPGNVQNIVNPYFNQAPNQVAPAPAQQPNSAEGNENAEGAAEEAKKAPWDKDGQNKSDQANDGDIDT